MECGSEWSFCALSIEEGEGGMHLPRFQSIVVGTKVEDFDREHVSRFEGSLVVRRDWKMCVLKIYRS